MSKFSDLQEWDEIIKNESDFAENEQIRSKNLPKGFSREISTTFGFMIGVDIVHLRQNMEGCGDFDSLYAKLVQNQSATIIRHLNRIRSTIMLNFAYISERTNIMYAKDYCPIYKLEILEDDFKKLEEFELNIVTGRSDLNEYLSNINAEIKKRIDDTKSLFPEWVNFDYIKSAFVISTDIVYESKKFAANRNYYPYQKYFNWKSPWDRGNIVLSDNKLLWVLYYNNDDRFTEQNKVTDISDTIKDGINDFIADGNIIQIFVDGENTDPYKLSAALQSLTDEELSKINKIIIYYDDQFSSKAWTMFKFFSCDIPTVAIPVNRLKEDKSLVDHKLVAGISKSVYQDGVDSIILCSGDSDFWAVIEDVPAKYLVMAESHKCGQDFRMALRERSILYCFLDRFKLPADNQFRKLILQKAFLDKLQCAIDNAKINVEDIYKTALDENYLMLSEQEIKNSFKETVDSLVFSVDTVGNLTVEM